MNIKIYQDRYTETCNIAGTQYEQNATMIKLDFSELDFLDDECVKTIHFFHDSLEENNYIGDTIIENDEFKIPKTVTEYENVLAFIQITKEDFIWKTKSFNLDFFKSLDVDKTLDEDELGILQELILEVKEIQNVTTDKFEEVAAKATEDFNKNATAKLNEYNENHTSKLNDYNENAQDKIEEYDDHIEELDNIVSKKTASGESISIDDALAYKIFGAKVDGNTSQNTTTGKNLYKPTKTDFSNGGVNVTIEENVITLNGEMTVNLVDINIGANVEIEANQYYKLSYHVLSGTGKISHVHSELNVNGELTWGWLSSRQVAKSSSEAGILDKMIIYCEEKTTFNNYQIVIQVEKVDGEDSQATDYEPYTGGEASPNPDYPQDIEVINGNVKIINCGKNLITKQGFSTPLNEPDYYGANTTYLTPLSDGWGHLECDNSSGSNTTHINFFIKINNIHVKPNTQYTIFSEIRNGSLARSITLNQNVDKDLFKESKGIGTVQANAGGIFKTLVTTKDVLTNDMNLRCYSSVYSGEKSSFDIRMMILEGDWTDKEVEYEQYKSNEHTIDLQGNELVKLTDDIKDEITIDKTGEILLNKTIQKRVLNGTENWILYTGYQHTFRFSIGANDDGSAKIILNGISDYLVSKVNHDFFDIGNGIYFAYTNSIIISMITINSVEELKAWLSENNVTCYYQLLNVSETINLGQLTNFKTYEGVNHFFLETNLATDFEIKYVQDLQKVISKQQEEINELKTLLSSKATSAMLLDNYANDLLEEV